MRTLTIGDRTISYDTGINYTPTSQTDMSGVGGAGETSPSVASESTSEASEANSSANSSEADYSGSASVCSEEDGSDTCSLAREGSRKLIKPDLLAMSQLLNFDEEEEDELESDEDGEEDQKTKSPTDWQKAVVKDLAQQMSEKVERRHSISLCDYSYNRRKNSEGSSANSSTTTSPKTSISSQTSNYRYNNSSNSNNNTPCRLNTSQMHASLQDEYNSPEWQRALQTLNLSLEEVAHIRSVLTKAELEALPLDGSVKENVGRGKVCFLCMKTRFGIFSRGQKCEMCKQIVCNRCHTKMNIPLEHFTATPVYALSPCQESGASSGGGGGGGPGIHQNQGPRSPIFKLGVPSLPGTTNSAGSAPSSPGAIRKGSAPSSPSQSGASSLDNSYMNDSGISTISGMTSLPPVTGDLSPPSFQPVSLPPIQDKYNTLPKQTHRASRRWSMISSRSVAREKLEGSPLNVCLDCKEMVLQVIRTSRTTKKMQLARSMFFSNLNPATYTHHRL